MSFTATLDFLAFRSMRIIPLLAAILFIGGGCIGILGPDDWQPETIEEITVEDTEDLSEDQVVAEEPGQFSDSVILDYYLSLPDRYFFGEYPDEYSVEDRTRDLTLVDAENYFLSFSPRWLDGNGSMAVFLHDDREFVLLEIKGCGPACMQSVYVLEYENEEWVDHSASMWPLNLRDEYITQLDAVQAIALLEFPDEDPENVPYVPLIEIPQFGTTITVREQFSGLVIGEITWESGQFLYRNVEVSIESRPY